MEVRDHQTGFDSSSSLNSSVFPGRSLATGGGLHNHKNIFNLTYRVKKLPIFEIFFP
jgi:hypothetical protein